MEMKFRIAVFGIFFLAAATSGYAQTNDDYNNQLRAGYDILNHSLGSIGKGYQGSADDPIARFIASIRGNSAVLQPTQQQVCDAWIQMPPDQPFTGNFTVAGFEVSLDKLCRIKR